MTSGMQIEREELLKMAALDVFGLLDEFESAQFNRAFRDAPAGVQDEMIALQAELASDPVFCANESPPPDLRAKVLERVARAVEEEAARLAPIATIGRGRALRHVDPHTARALDRSARTWRAASFILAASLMLVFILFARATRQAEQIAQFALDATVRDDLRKIIGPDLEAFANDPGSTPIAMRSEIAAPAPTGTIWIRERSSQAFILAQQLRPGREYALRATFTNAAGEEVAIELERVWPRRPDFTGFRVDNIDRKAPSIQTLAMVQWEIIDIETNTLVLATH